MAVINRVAVALKAARKSKAASNPGRPLDRGLGKRQVDLVQREGEAAVGVDAVGEGELSGGAVLCLRQQRRVGKARGDLTRGAGDANTRREVLALIRGGAE